MDNIGFGRRGEDIAVDFLRTNGFKIVKKNFRCRLGEIDIIAKKRKELYFVEVKSRKDSKFGTPLESITYAKRQTIIRVASYYLLRLKKMSRCHFSVIGVTIDSAGTQKTTFLPDAFETS